MPSNTFRQKMLNETSLRLQSSSRKIKPNVNIISQMRRTVFQSLKVLINHKMSYIVSLCYPCILNLCWIDTKININSLIKLWLRFDVIDGSWFFSAWNFTSVTQSIFFIGIWCTRKMKEQQAQHHMLIILPLRTTDVNFADWPLLQFLLSSNAN